MRIEDIDYSNPDQVEELNEKKKVAGKIIRCSIAEKDYLTEDEAVAYLGIGKNTLKNWVGDGLVVIRIGGRKLYWKKDIQNFLMRFRATVEPYIPRRK